MVEQRLIEPDGSIGSLLSGPGERATSGLSQLTTQRPPGYRAADSGIAGESSVAGVRGSSYRPALQKVAEAGQDLGLILWEFVNLHTLSLPNLHDSTAGAAGTACFFLALLPAWLQ